MSYTEAAFQADLCGIRATGVVQALAIVRDHLAHGTSPDDALALAVCHGSATLQFKLAWEGLARCPQDVRIGNCCVLVYEFDPEALTFACEKIVNQTV